MVVSSSWEELCYLGPLVTVYLVGLDDCLVLFFSPLVLFDVGVQVVMPPFSTLFTDSTW